MKKIITTLILNMLFLLPMMAQNEGERPRFSPEIFKARLESYIRDKADLTQEEGNHLFPLYYEMKQKQKDVYQQIHQLKKSQHNQQSQNATKTVADIMALKVKLAKIEQTYYNKMSKAIGGEKVLKVMYAEDCFHRDMLKLSDKERRSKKN